jgi:phospholipid-transporting ATPase
MLNTKDTLERRLSAVKSQRSTGELEDLALVIGKLAYFAGIALSKLMSVDGKSLSYALDKELSKQFLELAIMCKAVVCCLPSLFIIDYKPLMLCLPQVACRLYRKLSS